jgi:predicted deacylase
MAGIGKKCVSALWILILAGGIIQAQSTENRAFIIGDMEVRPGEIVSGYLAVPAKDGEETVIPVTVINGVRKGKVLALVAGVHGYEYPPILALYRLKKHIRPEDLSGTLVLVHIANLPGFQKRIIYYNPYDWKNLNRVFPGDPEGTMTQRIAHVLKTEVIDRCDALIDMHCGDGNEALIPYCYWMLSEDESLNSETKAMVQAFGIRHIIIDESRTKDISESRYLGNTAVLSGKPAITTESGYLGGTDETDIQRNVHGALSVMRYFHLLEGEPSPVEDPVWIDKYEVVYSDSDGLFYPLTQMGFFVKKGERVGYITDFLGKTVQEFKAPFTGMLLYIINTPPISKGEPVFEVGRIKE